jgi:hypothetical protein
MQGLLTLCASGVLGFDVLWALGLRALGLWALSLRFWA